MKFTNVLALVWVGNSIIWFFGIPDLWYIGFVYLAIAILFWKLD